MTLGLKGGGNRDGVVEGETEGLVSFVVALTPVEEVLVQVIPNWKESAARRVGGGVDTVRTSYTLRNCAWRNGMISVMDGSRRAVRHTVGNIEDEGRSDRGKELLECHC